MKTFFSPHDRAALGTFVIAMLAIGLASHLSSGRDLTFAQAIAKDTLQLVSRRYNLENPDIAMNAKGDMAMVWQEKKGRDYDVYAMKTEANSEKLNLPFRINRYQQNDQKQPRVGIDAQGNFAVVWESFQQDSSGSGVFAQRYSANGKKQGVEFRVNDEFEYNQMLPDISMNNNGDFAVVWTSEEGKTREKRIYLKTFSQTGSHTKKEVRVDHAEGLSSASIINPHVVLNDQNKILAVWQALKEGGWKIEGQVTDLNGAASAPQEFTISAKPEGSHTLPAVSVFEENKFIVVWEKNLKWEQFKNLNLVYENIQGRLVSDAGALLLEEFEVSVPAFNAIDAPEVTKSQGGATVIWEEREKWKELKGVATIEEKSDWIMKSQRLGKEGQKINEIVELNRAAEPYHGSKIAGNGNEKISVAWQGKHPRAGREAIQVKELALEVIEAPAPVAGEAAPAEAKAENQGQGVN